jgi:D-alanine-D-alanine ligase
MELKSIKIGVLGGGVSREREISLVSAKAAFGALQKNNLDVVFIDIATSQKEKVKYLISSCDLDLAFIALHGRFGEDGQIQKILEELDIPYTGSGSKASLLAMDKVRSKDIFVKSAISTPNYMVCLDKESIPESVKYPVVVKPDFEGSSLGVSIVDKKSDLGPAVNEAFSHGGRVIIEDYIEGRELTVGILDEKPLAVVEIIPKKGFYDFKTKYSDIDCPDYVVPAKLDEGICTRVQELGLLAHKALGCRHFSRADIRLGRDNVAYVLEVNSIPGLTSHSLLPLAAGACGMSFDKLILKMVELALYEKKTTPRA